LGLEALVTQITARLPDELVAALDDAASKLRRTRADVVRQAIEVYLDDFEDVAAAIQAVQDPADPVLEWDGVQRELLGRD
jgi:RHH-type transcriptional regulator, rel operon repressor / antitoxin RelB